MNVRIQKFHELVSHLVDALHYFTCDAQIRFLRTDIAMKRIFLHKMHVVQLEKGKLRF